MGILVGLWSGKQKTTVKLAFFDLKKKVPPALTYFSSSSWVLSFFFAPMVRDSNLFRSSSVRLRNLESKNMCLVL